MPTAAPSSTTPSRRADAELVAALRCGDGRAYEALLRDLGPRLLATARRLCGSEHDAQDALQDAMVACFRHIREFKGDSAVYTWMHRITVTTCLMRLRRRRRRNEASIEPLLPKFYDDGHRVNGSDPDWTASPEQLAQVNETRAIVRRCVDALPPAYRDVVLLRDIEGLDTSDAARLLGVNAGVVKTRLHRARQALRTLLEPHARTLLPSEDA